VSGTALAAGSLHGKTWVDVTVGQRYSAEDCLNLVPSGTSRRCVLSKLKFGGWAMFTPKPAASELMLTQADVDRTRLKLIDSWTILAKAGRCHVEAGANRQPVEDPMELLEILLEGGRLQFGGCRKANVFFAVI
jgi:hypothetical protein